MPDGDLSDFSNDLANDLGPLLVLFGESMTKQFLSQSTAWLDYFTFAMAPIGLITTITSAIRVCGHPTLRAFIGKSQEGHAAIEAELCTSTSRDVCELFNTGGITRVLGRPDILELVYLSQEDESPRLLLFRDYSQVCRFDRDPSWSIVSSPLPGAREPEGFAPNPNLSLNVGTRRRPGWVHLAIAATGLLLQLGVLIIAGVGAWVLDWSHKTSTSAQRNYAPVMFITGTVVMCFGMWSCAALIGQMTHKLSYRRNAHEVNAKSRLLWLQPGPQVIGDQTFDSFAYFEQDGDPIKTWTSSRKLPDASFELYTVIAVLCTLLGYIAQFIGLRGMRSWVSIAQLASTVVMSILRGLLRVPYLRRGDNRLSGMLNLVSGHELDWLACELFQKQTNQEIKNLRINGQMDELQPPDKNVADVYPICLITPRLPKVDMESSGFNIFHVREQLSHLTGHCSCDHVDEAMQPRKWDDSSVQTRLQAKKLSLAMCQAAEALVQKGLLQRDTMMLPIQAATICTGTGLEQASPTKVIKFVLRSDSDTGISSWKVESARLEAILGLWTWSLVSDKRLRHFRRFLRLGSSFKKIIKRARIVSVEPSPSQNNTQGSTTANSMKYWLGSLATEFSSANLTLSSRDEYGSINLLKKTLGGDENSWKMVRGESSNLGNLRWFFGWNLVFRQLNASSSGYCLNDVEYQDMRLNQMQSLDVKVIRSDHSLLDICTQELFVALATSLSRHAKKSKTTISRVPNYFRLENPLVTTLARAFEDSGLGSYSDILTGLVPAFGQRLLIPTPTAMLSALMDEATWNYETFLWDQAEELMRQAYHSHMPVLDRSSVDAAVLCSVGELCRLSFKDSFMDQERYHFGREGMQWITQRLKISVIERPEVEEVLHRYQDVQQQLMNEDPQDHEVYTEHLVHAIQKGNRTRALWILCLPHLNLATLNRSSVLTLAVRRQWDEIVRALLDVGVDPNTKDKDGYSAIFYSAKFGYGAGIELLSGRKAYIGKPFVDKQSPYTVAVKYGHAKALELLLDHDETVCSWTDGTERTLLSWAAQYGHEDVVRVLLEMGSMSKLQDADGRAPLSWAAAYGHANIVQLLLRWDIKGIDYPDNSGQTPLTWAARHGHLDAVRRLLGRGAEVDVRDENKRTPLSWAAGKGHEDVVEELLENGAEVHAEDGDGHTPLYWARRGTYKGTVEVLLEAAFSKDAKEP